jgi:hypothetical protein
MKLTNMQTNGNEHYPSDRTAAVEGEGEGVGSLEGDGERETDGDSDGVGDAIVGHARLLAKISA